jgi:hypothetical protein
MGVKNFKRLLIELNSELILVLGFGLGSHPDPIYTFFFGGGGLSLVTW